MAQQSANGAEESAQAAEQLSRQAGELRTLMSRFRLA